jgi:photosystem II stability/assembly factor-like uncharacterized protein
MKFLKVFSLLCIGISASVSHISAQQYDPSLYSCLKWRMIGPYRGGRTVGASGNVQQPNVFYLGVNNGGVWKTTDYGETWKPIFDDQPTGSIGDVAVAPSNPNTIYVGTGEGLQRPDLSVGNGMYKSTDAGKTWQYLGLPDALQIAGIDIDPKNENRVFAALLGHPYGPNKERGIYRTTDGGKTWKPVLYIDENTGAAQVTIDPVDPQIVYADLWAGRLAPWENGMWSGAGSGLYKSTDGGDTWKQLKNGLPSVAEGLERVGFCIAPSDHKRLYAVVNANEASGGIYRSDDAGESWVKINNDKRLWDRGNDFAEIKADPLNADIVYDANVVTWKSTDGGKTWNAFKGAPGGDDYHRLWINPQNPNVILLASDQGAVITVNGGETWSSWYNQPTAQFYHVSADNDFPYNVYGGQQESGSVCIRSRSDAGAISYRDWAPVHADEYAYVVADPLDPNIVYGGKMVRYDKRSGQAQDISPNIGAKEKYRFLRTAPVVFSEADKRTLFYAGNVLFKTRDGGNSWKVISPDLTRTSYDVAECIGIYRTEALKTMPQRGVIYTIAPSPIDSNTIWVGTDDGLIHVTHDGGKTWQNVTPPGLNAWSKISLMDASHTDKNTAYAAVNRIRLDDLHPHIYRTKDGGKTWQEIVNGLPNGPINVVKEDPVRKGLLFAGSERMVHVSFDDGENWQPLRMNMPATSIRDLVVKDDDLVIGTHGRSFWIMDNITSLRQLTKETATQNVLLYKPQTATRVRWNSYSDTPLPPEEPVGENPPDGAMIEYYLKDKAEGEVVLDIVDAAGAVVRHYSSKDTLYTIPKVNIPLYWIRPQQIVSGNAGVHRFLWDMRYAPLNVAPSYPISAIYKNTVPSPTSPWVMPGTYTVKLTVNGKVYTQPLKVRMDPRIKTSIKGLQIQHDLSYKCYEGAVKAAKIMLALNTLIAQTDAIKDKSHEIIQLNKNLKEINSGPAGIPAIYSSLRTAQNALQGADVMPATQLAEAANTANKDLQQALQKWESIKNNLKMLGSKLAEPK